MLETIRLLNSLEISKRILEKNLKIWSEVRSLETFSFLDRRRLSPEKSISMRAAILNYITKMGVLHFKHKMWLKDWFSSFPNGSVLKKRLQFTYIYRTYVRTFEQEEKNVEGFELTETALPEVQTWTANGKRDLWSLVTRLLHVCSHTYSETNVDLKFPHSARNDLRIIRDTKKRIT